MLPPDETTVWREWTNKKIAFGWSEVSPSWSWTPNGVCDISSPELEIPSYDTPMP